jgi:hypothetical protein
LRVLKGGSAEIKANQWYKFDIELDESDLQALSIKHNLAALTVIQKYKLLSKQAELLVTVDLEAQGSTGNKSSEKLMIELQTLIKELPKVEN